MRSARVSALVGSSYETATITLSAIPARSMSARFGRSSGIAPSWRGPSLLERPALAGRQICLGRSGPSSSTSIPSSALNHSAIMRRWHQLLVVKGGSTGGACGRLSRDTIHSEFGLTPAGVQVAVKGGGWEVARPMPSLAKFHTEIA